MRETAASIRQTLAPLYPPEETRALTHRIIEHVCGLPIHRQLLCEDLALPPVEKRRITEMTRRLAQSEPLQYVLGEALFCGLSFHVNPSVLIPRPETEELVTHILRQHTGAGLRVLDIGTGSGCIAATLAKRLPDADVTAIDRSPEALAVAAHNAGRNHVSVRFRQADLHTLSPEAFSPFDLIVSNPPYVRESEKAGMKPHVLNWEPHAALFVSDDDPLAPYRSIARFALCALTASGTLYLEINEALGAETVATLHAEGFHAVELFRDLSGKDRFMEARLPKSTD